MKIKYTTANGRISVDIEASSQRDVVEQLAAFQEVFDESACGKCQSENTRFVVRENDGNTYYELRCRACGARLSFGCNKDGKNLFPKRRDGDDWKPNNGWVKWNRATGKEE